MLVTLNLFFIPVNYNTLFFYLDYSNYADYTYPNNHFLLFQYAFYSNYSLSQNAPCRYQAGYVMVYQDQVKLIGPEQIFLVVDPISVM